MTSQVEGILESSSQGIGATTVKPTFDAETQWVTAETQPLKKREFPDTLSIYHEADDGVERNFQESW